MHQFHDQQLHMLGGLQNPNLPTLQRGGFLGHPLLNQNPNQITGFSPNGFMCLQNPNFVPSYQLQVMSAGIPSPAFLGNVYPQVWPSRSNSLGLEGQIASQNLQWPMLPCPGLNNQSSGWQWPQMNPNQAGGNIFSRKFSENITRNNFTTKFNGPGKWKPSNISSGNAWKKAKPFPRTDGRGQQQRNQRNTKFSEINVSTSMIHKRPIAVISDESEIRQWREARRRNFPTRTNIEKKLNPIGEKKEDMDSDAKARWQSKYDESEVRKWREARKRTFRKRTNTKKKLTPSSEKKEGMDSDAKARRKKLTPSSEKKEDMDSDAKAHPQLKYDENEVQQWREARKRNFPTRTNIEKKLTPNSEKKEDMDSDAKADRQMNPPNQASGNNFSSNSSENDSSNNFKTKFTGSSKKEPSNTSTGNAWIKEKPFPRIDGRGQQKRNKINTNLSEISDNTSMIRKRSLAVIYDESEVQQWREARKRNFPTRTNIEKKLTPSSEKKEDVDSNAKARRQQLKKILAKQAELGVPVAKVPTKLLSKYKPRGNKRRQSIKYTCKYSYNKSNSKRGRFQHDKMNDKSRSLRTRSCLLMQ